MQKKYAGFLTFSLVLKENQESEKSPSKKRGWKKKTPVVENNESANEPNQQSVSPASNTISKHKTMPSAPKTNSKCKWIGNDYTTQELATVNEVSNKDVNMQEPAAAAISKLNPIYELLKSSNDDDNLSEGNLSI